MPSKPQQAPEVRSAEIALIDRERQVYVLDREGNLSPQTAGGQPGLVWAMWNTAERGQASHSWPTWSPDGRQIACFAMEEEAPSQVVVIDVDGIGSVAVCELGERLPIYLFWSPDGRKIAILTQRMQEGADRLHLAVADSDQPDSAETLAEGSPLFFTWVDHRLATFVGDPQLGQSLVSIVNPEGRRDKTILPGNPGNFCAPVWVADRLMYVLQQGASASVVLAEPSGADEPEVVETLHGLVAFVSSPDGQRVARAVAPGGDGTPYRDLAIIDGRTGAVSPVADHPCLAFLWTPDGRALLTAQVDTDRNLIRWHRISLDGRNRHLADMYPTRDFGFYLRFFEQYSQSHPLVDPEGDYLLLAGGIEGFGDPHRTVGLWEVPLVGGSPRRIGEGVFGVYGPGRLS
ncbi:MAG: hypothetical protein EA397_13220 [Deltaproteobacteria bacterium]|nr:MAG: hypothetical protein EA397_13220 [Deltaproteobacteria bacterium]